MPKLSVKAGTTSKSVALFIQDSSSTTGGGLTGLVFNSAGLTAYWYQPGVTAPAAITLATLASATAAYSSGGFKELDSTNCPGHYRLDLPNAVLTGASTAVVVLRGATNMAQVQLEIELTAVDNQSATAFITGVNSLAPPTNWNLTSIDSNGRLDVIKIAGTTQTARDIGASVLLSSGTGTGQLDFSGGVVKANVTQLLGTAWLTPATAGTPDVNVKLLGGATVTATTSVTFPASCTVATTTGAVGSVTGDVGGNVTGNVGGNVTGSVGSVATGGITAASLDANCITAAKVAADVGTELADALLNRDMSAVTVTNSRSPINALRALRNKWTAASGTYTVYAEDDSTSAWTATISTDAAADPVTGADPA